MRVVSGSQGRAPAAGQSGRLNMSGSAGLGGTAGQRMRLGAAGPVPGGAAAGNISNNGRPLQVCTCRQPGLAERWRQNSVGL